MEVFDAEDIETIYPEIIKYILDHGARYSPRGIPTLDIGPTSIVVENPTSKIITNKVRRINPYFMIAEYLWITTQNNRADMIGFYNKKMWEFSDDGRTLHGAYGPRLMRQIPSIINKINLDKSTRQAVATIYQPRDQTVNTKDFPCNIMLHFLPRGEWLDLVVYVRSQDIYLGLPYDFYHWASLLEIVANQTSLGVGTYTHICGSLHAYESNVKILNQIVDEEPKIISFQESTKTSLISNIHRVSTLEYKIRKTDFTTEELHKTLEEILSIDEDDTVKDMLSTLLYYRIRRNPDITIDTSICGSYSILLKHLEWY